MKALITYLFKHKQYQEVNSVYAKIQGTYKEAYKIWADYYSVSDNGDYSSKEHIANSFAEIKELNNWIGAYWESKSKRTEGLRWFLKEKSMLPTTNFCYSDYKVIAENASYIRTLEGYWQTYNQLLHAHKEAVCRFVSSSENHSYDEIKSIALAKEQILEIASTLKKAHTCEAKYKRAWAMFSNGISIADIPISRLETISVDAFESKEDFLRIYEQKSNLINLILGKSLLPTDSFSKETIEQEDETCVLLRCGELYKADNFNANIHLDNEKELKRAILDSQSYGIQCNFAADFTVSNFYDYRKKFDAIGVSFDDAVDAINQNKAAIKAYNNNKSGKPVVYIENYYDIVYPESDLCKFVENYKKEQDSRNIAKSIQRTYSKGFAALFGEIELDTCSFSIIQKIIDKESDIQSLEYKIQEEEKRKAVEEAKRILLSKVSAWDTLFGDLHYNYILNYYPTKCNFEANDAEWDDRWTVWNFKNTPGKTSLEDHEEALDKVIPEIKEKLVSTFGFDCLRNITLVCIPASSQQKTVARYEDFSRRLCNETGMTNAYHHMNVISSSEEKKFGGKGMTASNVHFENSFFNGKNVLLFDDVITKGESMLRFKRKMEELGATVVAGFSIGRTKHERPNSRPSICNPYDDLPF